MATPKSDIQPARVELLKSVLPSSFASSITLLETVGTKNVPAEPPSDFHTVLLANNLARLSHDNALIVKPLLNQGDSVKSLRDVALNFDDEALTALVRGEHASTVQPLAAEAPVVAMAAVEKTSALSVSQKAAHDDPKVEKPKPALTDEIPSLVRSFQQRLFQEEPSAMLSRMVRTGVIPITKAASQNAGSSAHSDDEHANAVKQGVVKFLEKNQPNFNIRKESALRPLADSKSFDGIQDIHKDDVVRTIKKLQITQALASTPETIPVLFKAGLDSASKVASMPQSNFISNFAGPLGGTEVAKQIHSHATNATIRNTEALTTMLQTLRGSGLAAIDGGETRAQRLAKVQKLAALPAQANLEELFGSLDSCACSDCSSITSPAAYLVELFEFLRNNNLDPNSSTLGHGWAGTPLEKLLRRRPDLVNLQLTCANTNTVLPYIDLANEVMESFVVHLDGYRTDTNNPKQSNIDVFNIDPDGEGTGGSSPELLAEPQNTNYQAYCILKSAVYPAANLPYNQPIEEIRALLGFLGTSKTELGDVYQSRYIPPSSTIPNPTELSTQVPAELTDSTTCDSSSDTPEFLTSVPQKLTTANQAELTTIHKSVLQRANDAESLLLTQEEYIIVTKEAFWPKEYFDIRHGTTFSTSDYQTKIGVKTVYNYWGTDYSSTSDMLSTDETAKKGLTFVKKQFLPRSGLIYEDLVNLLQIQLINPHLPSGKSLEIMQSLKFSYMFLRSLIDPTAKSTKDKLKPLLIFLDMAIAQNIKDGMKNVTGIQQPGNDPNGDQTHGCGQRGHVWNCDCKARSKLHHWILKNFEKIGCMIVLESGEGPLMPWEADLIIPAAVAEVPPTVPIVPKLALGKVHGGLVVASHGSNQPTDPFPNGLPSPTSSDQVIAHLNRDGRIVASNGFVMARVFPTGPVLLPNWAQWSTKYGSQTVCLRRTDGNATTNGFDGFIYEGSSEIIDRYENTVIYSPVQDDCNLDNVRLRHLDSSPVTEKEYDIMQRFLRLWTKLGWSMQELDAALRGLGGIDENGGGSTDPPVPSSDPGSESSGSQDIDWSAFQDSCSSGNCGGSNCKKCSSAGSAGGVLTPTSSTNGRDKKPRPKLISNITPGFLHQIKAVNQLVTLTGLSVLQLLSFWTNIDIFGPNSLYSQLFLTHNIVGTDPVFKADSNGNFFATSPTPKISDHIPVLLAAFKLRLDGFTAIMAVGKIPDELTLENVSAIYRHALLASILGIKPVDLATIAKTFVSPWASAQATLDLVNLWNRMDASGFTFQQIAYVTKGIDDPLHPIGPSQTSILKTTKLLYDGLNNIDSQNPDISDIASATSDAVTAKAQLLFGTDLSSQILGFLEGTLTFSTNAPKGLSIVIPQDLATRVKYADGDNAKLQVTGQLTAEMTAKVKSLSPNPKWSESLARLAKQALAFFQNSLADVFPKADEVKTILITGDSPDTAPGKRLYFLQQFMPFLRRRLAEMLIGDTMGSAVSLPADITSLLLSSILVDRSNPAIKRSSLEALEQIHNLPAEPQNGWTGFLLVSTTDTYTFSCLSLKDDDAPPAILLDNLPIAFTTQQADPTNVWFSKQVHLIGGRLYPLTVTGQSTSNLQWMTIRSIPTTIPSSALLPNYSINGTSQIFAQLAKAAFIINGFNFIAEEISYLQTNGEDFGSFDLNVVTLDAWKRLNAYTSLRNSIPRQPTTLIDFFKWASSNPKVTVAVLLAKINDTTSWDVLNLAKLCAPENFNLTSPSQFKNEINLVKLQKALNVADRIGMDINKLFKWADPSIKFWPSHAIAEDIRRAARATMSLTDWETAIKPIFDGLRKGQSQALVSYLTVQPELVAENVIDADSLFEFFLIDVQMGACLETSRLKQATSSVQLFIQRCMLGLEAREDGSGVALNALDRERWTWMQRYRVWEAARKVFLYPENVIISSLRDDKSPIYLLMESSLLQKDITSQTITDAMQSYLFSLDAVANLEVIGVFLQDEQLTVDDGLGTTTTHVKCIHLFGRSRQAPFFFSYRYYDILAQNWAPWQAMQADIPNYEVNSNGKLTGNGTYLVPFTFNGRLLAAIPQLIKKTVPAAISGNPTWKTFGDGPMAASTPTDYWEIKMGYTELRNGKWTQKIITSQACYEDPPPSVLPSIDSFQFVPRLTKGNDGAMVSWSIDCVRAGTTLIGTYIFDGKLMRIGGLPTTAPDPTTLQFDTFEYSVLPSGPDPQHLIMMRRISSLQADGSAGNLTLFDVAPAVSYPNDSGSSSEIMYTASSGGTPTTQPFNHQFVHELMSKVIAANSVDGIYAYFQTLTTSDQKDDAFGQDDAAVYSELKRPYSLYNWEIGFHMPMALADSYLKTQQFDLALKMCNYVFDPFYKGSDEKRFWRWPPFREVDSIQTMEKLFDSLEPENPVAASSQINQWRDNPFSPHVIARLRPVAYMKWAVMKYIEILIAYGDYYFTQNTLEMIPLAIQCYILASHIYGKRGQKIPKRGNTLGQTYKSLGDSWDPFGNAMVQLELMFPFSNQTDMPVGSSNGVVGLANIFGFATTRYFCIPDNPQLTALRDQIDDRLFKIRHCQDIFGNVQHLPLYEPPINPSLLVAAAAQGLSIASVLSDLDSTMPNYRFPHLFGKAIELCGELKSLGNALLSVKEKQDVEALALLRQQHEGMILTMGMDDKKMALDEAQKSLEALQQNRLLPAYKMQHFLKLLGLPIGGVPTPDASVVEIDPAIPAPVDSSGYKLIPTEKEEVDKASDAATWQRDIGILETIASVFHVLPTINEDGKPLGVGVTASWGFANLANAVSAVARGLQVHAADLSYQSISAGRNTNFLRASHDRVLNANSSAYEVKNIDKQITTQNIRIAMADHGILVQQQLMDNSDELLSFLKNKYTNQELYIWMQNSVQDIYHQLYNMAHDWAKKAEKAYRLERGIDDTSFIQFGYWESAYDGLLAGERLYMSLKQLEAAYNETRGYDFEVSKFISLRQVSPMSLLELRDTGSCQFSIPEILFDMDYPGQYRRKIKSVAVSVPCTVGPYTGVNCTLRLLSHQYRTSPTAASAKDYAPKVDQEDTRFSTTNIPLSAIAVSSAQSDSGVFELNFHDERFMPFEGAGAISDWSLELPDGFRQFDYSTITDIVLRVRYTSMDGGAALGGFVSQYVSTYMKTITDISQTDGLFALFDVKSEFASEWYRAMNPGPADTSRVLTLTGLNNRLPVYTKGYQPKKILASDIMIVTDAAFSPGNLLLEQGGGINTIDFQKSHSLKTMSLFAAHNLACPIDNWVLTIKDTTTPVNSLLLLARYALH